MWYPNFGDTIEERCITRHEENSIIAKIFPGEKNNIVEHRKRVHKNLYAMLKRRSYLR